MNCIHFVLNIMALYCSNFGSEFSGNKYRDLRYFCLQCISQFTAEIFVIKKIKMC